MRYVGIDGAQRVSECGWCLWLVGGKQRPYQPVVELGVEDRHALPVGGEAAGADLNMVRVICGEEDGSGTPVFPCDIELIDTISPTPAMVVVDCWLDTVPAKLQVRDAQQARQALHPWKELETRTGAAAPAGAHGAPRPAHA